MLSPPRVLNLGKFLHMDIVGMNKAYCIGLLTKRYDASTPVTRRLKAIFAIFVILSMVLSGVGICNRWRPSTGFQFSCTDPNWTSSKGQGQQNAVVRALADAFFVILAIISVAEHPYLQHKEPTGRSRSL